MKQCAPVEGGEEGEVTGGDEQLPVVGHDIGQALEQQPCLARLPPIERNALCILPHSHQAKPTQMQKLVGFVAHSIIVCSVDELV